MSVINIITSKPFTDVSGVPLSGTLFVSPSSNFSLAGGGQATADIVSRSVQGGLLTGALALYDPATTSPQGIGYTFRLEEHSGRETIWPNVLIVPDANGNYDVALLNTGLFVTAVPKTVISVATTIVSGTGTAADNVLPMTAGPNPISLYTVVAVLNGLAVTASTASLAMMGAAVGLAIQSAQPGALVDVQFSGPVTFTGWNWTPGQPVFVGLNGVPTQVLPLGAFVQALGLATNATTILISLQPPIGVQ